MKGRPTLTSFRTILIESPCRLSYKSGYMVVHKEDETAKIHLSEISSIVLHTMQANIGAYLLSELAKQKISLVITNERHNPVGQYLPIYGAHNTSKRITEQLNWGEPIKKRVWQRVIREKIKQQGNLLLDRGAEEAHLLLKTVDEVRSGDSTNREAHAARVYFAALFGSDFNRDIACPTNFALNYGYAILLSMLNREIVARGYLTQKGICHRSEYNEFNFACDLMEPFRPIVDRIVDDWVADSFDSDTKRLLTDIPNKLISYRGGSYRLSSVVGLFVQDCINALAKRISVDEIEGFSV
ncbi:type II CRISPR-associated endonuclease Cas1 [Collinsella sp. zg1085]|uniref:type II CRISPR-associated endonuclease Cas1 n=1 Tax=Collinsella sp. zg1085 TaxID=2844380 RepID=UPI001C0D8616|nr:type II CRISPR-associated endonuclease Cas1 [Collinsella sp. zg1085]QWT17274.1 type II CRISPR-associated endonuclease Cas1 [Collinsella sp. zg1085]